MAEKFNPAPHDKHAEDPREALAADREMHTKLRKPVWNRRSRPRTP